MPVENNPAAFPRSAQNEPLINGQAGMTLRNYFAAAALQGILANPELVKVHSQDVDIYGLQESEYFISDAYEIADAMLEFRATQ